MPTAMKPSTQSSTVRLASAVSTRDLKAAWLAMRASLVAKRGSLTRPSSPSARQNFSYCSGLRMTTLMKPSAALNASAGVTLGLRLPTRAGATPEAK